jgi:transcriptional regulator with XRE-family HTH domain
MNLTEIIKSKGFKNKQVAEKIGVTEVTLSNWRNKPEMMPFCKAVAIADFIGLTMNEFTALISF